MERADPRAGVGGNGPGGKVGSELEEEAPKTSLGDEGRTWVAAPSCVRLVVPSGRYLVKVGGPTAGDDLLGLVIARAGIPRDRRACRSRWPSAARGSAREVVGRLGRHWGSATCAEYENALPPLRYTVLGGIGFGEGDLVAVR